MIDHIELPPRRQGHVVDGAKLVVLAHHEPCRRGREDPHGANGDAYFYSRRRLMTLDRGGSGLQRSKKTCLLKSSVSQNAT